MLRTRHDILRYGAYLLGARLLVRRVKFAFKAMPEPWSEKNDGRAREVAALIDRACRFIRPKPTCLERCLVIWWLLRREGIPAAICLASNTPETDTFHAHAIMHFERSDDPTLQTFTKAIVPERLRF